MRSRLAIGSAAALALVASAAPAEAHLNSTGMGPLYDGSLHFIVSPEDLLPALALALLAGLRSPAHGRSALFVLPGAWLLGGLAGFSMSVTTGNAVVSALWILLLGVLLAAEVKVSIPLMAALAALLGLYHGYLNGTGLGRSISTAGALLGIAAAVFVLVALAAAFVVRIRAGWARIAVRVAGSWIAATGLLLIGWAVRRS